MTWENSGLTFVQSVELSEVAMAAVLSANKMTSGVITGETISQWGAAVYRGAIKKELFTKFSYFYRLVERVVAEIRSAFHITFQALKVNDQIFIIDDNGVLHPTHVVLDGDCNVTATVKINGYSLDEFVKGINSSNHYLYAFSLLVYSANQTDLKLRVVQLAMAAEIGIKEFYGRKLPDLKTFINSISSPPIEKLYGSLYEEYFGEKFPLQAKIGKLITKRNKIVHSNKNLDITIRDVVLDTHTVQRSLAILQMKLDGSESIFIKNYQDIGEFQDRGNNKAQFGLTKSQERKVGNNEAIVIGRLQMKSIFSSSRL